LKLGDFRKSLRHIEVAPEVGRHPSGAMFIGIGGLGGDKTVMACFRREADGTMTLICADKIHELHDFRPFRWQRSANHDNLRYELVQPRASSDMPYSLGMSFMDRYLELTNQTWMNNEAIDETTLAAIMSGTRSDSEPARPGRVKRPILDKHVSSTTGSREVAEVALDDYLLFCDNAYRPPILCRYLKTGIEAGRPVIFAQADNSGSIHVGHGACFYPAETVPCATCKETGRIDADSIAAPPLRIGEPCPTCLGLSRVWRCRPWPHPEATENRPLTFAEANPMKWRGKRIGP